MSASNLLTGSRVRLGSLQEGDIETITGWYQNPAFMRLYDATPAAPRSRKNVEQFINSYLDDDKTYFFTIRRLEDNALVGIIDVSGILWNQGTGWLGIAIGDPANRGKGYGSEATRLLLDFAFRELNLHRIQLTVFAYNEAAIHLYEKLGFKREGAHRQLLHRDGKRYDMIVYGMLRHEWEAS